MVLKKIFNRFRSLLGNDRSGEAETEVDDPVLTPDDRRFIGKVDRIISQNIHRKEFGVNAIVEKMPMGRTTFYLSFKRVAGKSIGSYITDYRIARAKSMLGDSSISIETISKALGFTSRSYFSTFFKEHTGETPAYFRKKTL